MATFFRHQTIRRFKIERFEFVDFMLRIDDPEEVEAFRALIENQPRYIKRCILEYPEGHEESIPRPISGPRVIKGNAMTSASLRDDKADKAAKDSAQPDTNIARGGTTSNTMQGKGANK